MIAFVSQFANENSDFVFGIIKYKISPCASFANSPHPAFIHAIQFFYNSLTKAHANYNAQHGIIKNVSFWWFAN